MDIGEVSTAQDMNSPSNTMRSSSESLSGLSSQLRNMISVFKVSTGKASVTGSRQTAGDGELFPWTDKLALGMSEIDKQHKKLVALINQLLRAMKSNQSAAQAGKILDELAQYAITHFAFEEKLFDTHNYFDNGQPRHASIAYRKRAGSFSLSGYCVSSRPLSSSCKGGSSGVAPE